MFNFMPKMYFTPAKFITAKTMCENYSNKKPPNKPLKHFQRFSTFFAAPRTSLRRRFARIIKMSSRLPAGKRMVACALGKRRHVPRPEKPSYDLAFAGS